jgi:hypothetical protein
VAKENETVCEAALESATTNVACVVPELPSATTTSRTETDGVCAETSTLVANSSNAAIIKRVIRIGKVSSFIDCTFRGFRYRGWWFDATHYAAIPPGYATRTNLIARLLQVTYLKTPNKTVIPERRPAFSLRRGPVPIGFVKLAAVVVIRDSIYRERRSFQRRRQRHNQCNETGEKRRNRDIRSICKLLLVRT